MAATVPCVTPLALAIADATAFLKTTSRGARDEFLLMIQRGVESLITIYMSPGSGWRVCEWITIR